MNKLKLKIIYKIYKVIIRLIDSSIEYHFKTKFNIDDSVNFFNPRITYLRGNITINKKHIYKLWKISFRKKLNYSNW